MPRTVWLCVVILAIAAGCSATADEAPTATASLTTTPDETSVPPATPTEEQATNTLAPMSTSTASVPIPSATLAVAPTPTTPVADWGNSEIYVMNPDGSGQRRLTHSTAQQGEPAWSPDGSRIALATVHRELSAAQGTVIEVMNADGTNVQTLSDGFDNGPVWSPDGSWIAFTSNRDGHTEIYVMRADGSDERRLTSSDRGSSQPAWSPDGALIAFVNYAGDYEQLMVMDADGGNQRPLRISPNPEFEPTWSPDGTQLAFVSSIGFGAAQIHVMNADGSNVRNLSNNTFSEYQPTWSPDGTAIAFTRQDGFDGNVWVMEADGSDVRQLTDAPHGDSGPAWSPDGSLIAFASNRDGGQPVECNWWASGSLAQISSMETMTWMAHQVVVGTVTEELPPAFGEPLNPEFQPSLPIYTDYLFEIEQQYRGLPAEVVRIRQPGGTIGDCIQTYDSLAPLKVGQRVLIFLTEDDQATGLPPAFYVTGGPQGHFVIGSDEMISNGLDPEQVAVRMTLNEVAALVRETLAGEPPPDAFQPVSIEDAPPALP